MAFSEAEIARFWPKVSQGAPGECWNWTASKQRGYGQIAADYAKPRRPPIKAHRMSYELAYGPPSEDLCVLHKCGNPACVNPGHLYAGTQKENADDRAAHGRTNPPRGEACHFSKLTKIQVEEIRGATGITQKKLGELYGVTEHQIWIIRNGRSWK